MLEALMVTAWSGFAVCAGWVFISAKTNTPITMEDAKVMWVMHKKNAECKSRKWQPVKKRKGKIVGFKCECGYKYEQKRPVLSRTPKRSEHPAPYLF